MKIEIEYLLKKSFATIKKYIFQIHQMKNKKLKNHYQILAKYQTDKPRSYEELAEECEVSRATVFRTIKKYLFLYKYLPGEELNTK